MTKAARETFEKTDDAQPAACSQFKSAQSWVTVALSVVGAQSYC